MKTALFLAETDLLLAAGFEDLLRDHPQIAWAGLVRSQPALEAALQEQEHGIALIAHALLKDLDTLLALGRERDFRLVLLLPPQQEPPWEHLRSFDGVIVSTAKADAVLACLRAISNGGRCAPASQRIKPKLARAGDRIRAQLSPRQVQILTAVARGEKNAAIAQRLGTTEQVVKNLLRGIYDLTGVSDRLELALYVLHHPELSIHTGTL